MSYGMSATIDRPFDEVVLQVRAALAEQGFGVVSEIDLQATLKSKIGVDIDSQLILGACNPGFAHQALMAEPAIGLLLPCNVVIRRTDEGTVVEMIDPKVLVQLTGNADLAEFSNEVGTRLRAALAAVVAK